MAGNPATRIFSRTTPSPSSKHDAVGFSTACADSLLPSFGAPSPGPLSPHAAPISPPPNRRTCTPIIFPEATLPKTILQSTSPPRLSLSPPASPFVILSVRIIDKGYKVKCYNILHPQVWLGLCAIQGAPGTSVMNRAEDTYEQPRSS